MLTTRIPNDKLEAYFDAFSKHFLRNETTDVADVELVSMDAGDQTLAASAHVSGITYDPRTNALEVALEGADHRVYNPTEIWTIEENDGFISAIEVVRNDGAREILKLHRLALRRRH